MRLPPAEHLCLEYALWLILYRSAVHKTTIYEQALRKVHEAPPKANHAREGYHNSPAFECWSLILERWLHTDMETAHLARQSRGYGRESDLCEGGVRCQKVHVGDATGCPVAESLIGPEELRA